MISYGPILQTLSLEPHLSLDVLRLDLVHAEISGNKWFKLKNNLAKAIDENHTKVITFGGAVSNHIAATAAACKFYGLTSVGIIRGEQPKELNTTLAEAKENGMQLHFVSREAYAQKESAAFQQQIKDQFGAGYIIPEGGNNEAGMLGCMDILKPEWDYDYILCACGTATTFAGLVAAAKPMQTVIGISVLKGENKLPAQAMALLNAHDPSKKIKIYGNDAMENLSAGNHFISSAWCFSGYAKCDKALIDFKRDFEKDHNVPLDYVYTAKLFYAALDLVKTKLAGKNVLVIHSGGLQGNRSFEARYGLAHGQE